MEIGFDGKQPGINTNTNQYSLNANPQAATSQQGTKPQSAGSIFDNSKTKNDYSKFSPDVRALLQETDKTLEHAEKTIAISKKVLSGEVLTNDEQAFLRSVNPTVSKTDAAQKPVVDAASKPEEKPETDNQSNIKMHDYVVGNGQSIESIAREVLKKQDIQNPTKQQIQEAKDQIIQDNQDLVHGTGDRQYFYVGDKIQVRADFSDELKDSNAEKEKYNNSIKSKQRKAKKARSQGMRSYKKQSVKQEPVKQEPEQKSSQKAQQPKPQPKPQSQGARSHSHSSGWGGFAGGSFGGGGAGGSF